VFAAAGEVDFTEVAQRALWALGGPDAPTDLLLALDYRIKHILVDEFQDTSVTQLLLLESLTAGWQADDGRTLFLVGDPMQSIYRFRQAEVGLFLRAHAEGLGTVRLEPLTLSVNFRSQADIVDWVNGAFERVLPAQEDYAAGAVSYAPCEPVHPAEADAVSIHAFFDGDADAEAHEVARLVQSAQGGGTVAVLVRSRPHLERIVPALKAAGVRFRAIEIDPLERRQVVQDLLALTRALSHPGDRLAWLSVLRAPWCGLTLDDLHALSDAPVGAAAGASGRSGQLDLFANDPGGRPADVPVARDSATVWQAMCDETRLARLSPDGRRRLDRVRGVLEGARRDRLRGTLRECVERAWLALGGPACTADETGLEDAEGFLDFLERAEQAGNSPHSDAFAAGIARLYASPDARADGSVEIMTIHKAKGLEFDTVIVPGLGSPAPKPEQKLLLWIERAGADSPATLLLAPVKESGGDGDPIYKYLERLDAEREGHEDARLLYVAVTRAKKHLHLLGSTRLGAGEAGAEPKTPASGSLLQKLWPAVEDAFVEAARLAAVADDGAEPAAQAPLDQDLVRLARDWKNPAPPSAVDWARPPERARELDRIEFSWAGETARRVGSVVHRWLQQIAADALRGWDVSRVDSMGALFRRELAARGVEDDELARAAGRVRSALVHAVTDERGRWLLGPRHEARNEYRLTGRVDGLRVSVVVDRTFVDDEGRRWIVDYKTSSHEGAGLDAFLDRERERYAAQLATYARLMGASRPRLGLYFPLAAGWREWE
jgi:ATP-dependent helicase/nuclease subunit A